MDFTKALDGVKTSILSIRRSDKGWSLVRKLTYLNGACGEVVVMQDEPLLLSVVNEARKCA
jgi:hypothetical protein